MIADGAACAPETVTAADGAQLTACAHGGHVLGWTPAGGRPRLWLSPTARCGPGLAIRGGIPVIFPQFAGRGPLPKHGFARDRAWRVETMGDAGSRPSGGRPVGAVAGHARGRRGDPRDLAAPRRAGDHRRGHRWPARHHADGVSSGGLWSGTQTLRALP
jgi:hypothetical protein